MKFKVGDKVKFIKDMDEDFGFKKDTIVVITEVFNDHYCVQKDKDYWYSNDSFLELVQELPELSESPFNETLINRQKELTDQIEKLNTELNLINDLLKVRNS